MLLGQALKGFALEEITVSDVANIDQYFVKALPISEYLAIPPAVNGFSHTSAVDWISFGHLRVKIADPEAKTSQGGDINMLFADRVNLIKDKEQVATFEGGEAPRLADESSYEPEVDIIVKYPDYVDARHGNIDGNHRREAKRMVKLKYSDTYQNNKGILYTSDNMYIGLSPEVCRYMSMKLNEAGHTVLGDTSMH
eukprot:jgi/Tetstr1/457263/TSEL_004191.t1